MAHCAQRQTPITEGADAGAYLIKGTKIFITWGDHELADNVIHLVLARTPDAPAGSRGISLFLVPKFHVAADGTIGQRNDLAAVSLEHKLGIHASPTCVMSYGDHDACIGELVGRENEGLKAMFTMMNSARINVGSQGIQLAQRALQQASVYARSRVQSARAGAADKMPVAIIEHPDVRRMLLRMRSLTEASRALLYYTAGQVDRGALGDSAAQARADLLVPLLKSWGTDIGVEVTSLNIQIHGGMGFIEETGAAQLFRDARIAPIYEGTNGIQAADLVTRKLAGDGGAALAALMQDIAGDSADTPQVARAGPRMCHYRGMDAAARDTGMTAWQAAWHSRPCARLRLPAGRFSASRVISPSKMPTHRNRRKNLLSPDIFLASSRQRHRDFRLRRAAAPICSMHLMPRRWHGDCQRRAVARQDSRSAGTAGAACRADSRMACLPCLCLAPPHGAACAAD